MTRHLPLVLHGEGTLQVGWQVFEAAYKESESKQLLQESRRQLGLLLLVGVGGALLQTARHLQVSAWTHTHMSHHTRFREILEPEVERMHRIQTRRARTHTHTHTQCVQTSTSNR